MPSATAQARQPSRRARRPNRPALCNRAGRYGSRAQLARPHRPGLRFRLAGPMKRFSQSPGGRPGGSWRNGFVVHCSLLLHRYHGFCCDCVYSRLCVIYRCVCAVVLTCVAQRNPAIAVEEWNPNSHTQTLRSLPCSTRRVELRCPLPLSVVLHLTSYFFNWPVRMWPICRPEGAVGTYSPRCRGEWPYNIPWPLCSLLWGRIGQAELQAQTHQKSVSWNGVPEVGLAHDPGPGN
jgi:hypothetical protein